MKREEAFERVAKDHRTTIEEAGTDGIGTREPGIEPAAPAYAGDTSVTDLGVDEPALSPTMATDEARAGDNPTGMFAGETKADQREEDAVRQVLETRFPDTKGMWKAGGRIPGADDALG